MAIVPPGNKQIGDYTNIVVTNSREPIFKDLLQAGFVVSKDLSPSVFYNHLTAGFVVTREVSTRVETLIMNLKYNTPGELTFT
jgi:hypothetical protein